MLRHGSTRTRWIVSVGAAVTAAALLAGVNTVSANAAGTEPGPVAGSGAVATHEVEYFDGPGAEPRRKRVPAQAPARITGHRSATVPAPTAAEVTPVQSTGPVSGRLDLVVMGDGYTAGQQADFHADAQATLDAVFAIEPYASYRGLFNIWLVDSVSAESGVSGDPTAEVVKNTAVSSSFFCDGTERLLCLDTSKVTTYANQAPASDIVFVIANSTKYGGAGYSFSPPADRSVVPRHRDHVLRQPAVVPHRRP
ncbi:M64 family metallopeptidase [Streptomyces sp. NPDC047974]|uniref:M64 family metallopeptidase n=1 Tax=Streptomyces sp. NPDC047974 TaxID=3154343 RepID=UPI0034026BFA